MAVCACRRLCKEHLLTLLATCFTIFFLRVVHCPHCRAILLKESHA